MSEPVFSTYDQDALEFQYNARLQVPDSEQRMAQMARLSAAYRERAGEMRTDVPYGPAARERMDVFPGHGERCPVLLFIHGGYWRSRDKSNYSFLAEPFNAAGVTVVILEYSLCPHVTLDQIVRQVRAACTWVWNNIDDFASNHHRIFAMGNSAGAHLAAMLAATDWEEVHHALPSDLIKGAMGLSGLYDLEPVLLHSVNEDLGLDEAGAGRNSPVLLEPTIKGPYISAVGGDESDEFRRQSRQLAETWRKAGADIEYVEVAGRNHFSILADMLQPDYVLLRRQLSMIKR